MLAVIICLKHQSEIYCNKKNVRTTRPNSQNGTRPPNCFDKYQILSHRRKPRDTTSFTYLTKMLLYKFLDRNLSNCTQFIGELNVITPAIRQLCGIERFMVRTTEAIKTHFFSAIRAFTQLELMRAEELIENWYEVQRNLSLQVACDFILEHLKHKVRLNAHNPSTVNA